MSAGPEGAREARPDCGAAEPIRAKAKAKARQSLWILGSSPRMTEGGGRKTPPPNDGTNPSECEGAPGVLAKGETPSSAVEARGREPSLARLKKTLLLLALTLAPLSTAHAQSLTDTLSTAIERANSAERPAAAPPPVRATAPVRDDAPAPARARASRGPVAAPLPRLRADYSARRRDGGETAEDARVAEVRDSVLNQLEEAARSGLISLPGVEPDAPRPGAGARPPVDEDGRRAAIDDPAADLPAPEGEAAGSGPGWTSLADQLPRRIVTDFTFDACPPDAALDPTDWLGAEEYREGLGAMRRALIDESGRFDPEAIYAYARRLLANGLGYEARAALNILPETSAESAVYHELAAIIEGEPADPDGPILKFANCGRRHALWRAAALAGPGPKPEGHAAAAKAMRGAYAASDGAIHDAPAVLQRLLGGRIALAALDAGADALAQRIWRAIPYDAGPATAEMALVAALSRFEQGGRSGAIRRLVALARQRGEAAPEAAFRAARAILAGDPQANIKLSETLTPVLDDLAFVLRGAPGREAMLRAASLLDARSGRLPQAVARLDRAAKRDTAEDPQSADRLRARARAILRGAMLTAEPGDPADALALLIAAGDRLEAAPRDERDENDAARIRFAERMAGAGAPILAERILPDALTSRNAVARRVRARAALNRGDPAAALDVLGGLRDAESRTLRADALRSQTVPRPDPDAVFDAIPGPAPGAPLGAARRLIEGAETDRQMIEEMIADG